MKTIEEKAKAYDEAVNKMKEIMAMDNNPNPVIPKEIGEYLFPELKESEDERIRKELIEKVKETPACIGFNDKNAVLAWLEKQGEKLDEWKEGDILALVIKGRRAMKQNGEQITIQYPDEWVKANPEERKYFFEEFEKQGEQKPAKVEPKFNEGDWLIDKEDNTIFTITKVSEHTYKYTTNTGKEYSCTHYSLEQDARPWNYKDAKDGDVLATDKGGVFIYAKTLYNKPYAYCGVDKFGVFKDNCLNNNWANSVDNIHPATKEQQDLLFTKMKEAGYEWDEIKKELKKPADKIEPKFKVGDIITPKDGGHEPWQIMQVDILDKKYRFKDGYVIHFSQEDDYELVEQKPAEWSEKDEAGLADTIWAIKQARTIAKDENDMGNLWYAERWLKSLKGRVQPQPKQEWSQEDSRILYNVKAYIGYAAGQRGVKDELFKEANEWLNSLPIGFTHNKNYNEDMVTLLVSELKQIANDNNVPEQYQKEINWLKSLRPQQQWKPTQEQMKCLAAAVEESGGNFVLDSLYEQLKKLYYDTCRTNER